MIYLVYSEINRYDQPYLIISRIVKYQSFVINIINLLGALYLISIKLFLILISKLVALTPETVRTIDMFIRMRVITGNLKIISDSWIRSIISKGRKYRFPAKIDFLRCREKITASLNEYCNFGVSESMWDVML